MTASQLDLAEAIARYVRSGQTVALEGFGHLVPTAAAHEIVRQGIADLTLARMNCDPLVDEMLAAGCVTRLVSSFMGNSNAGSLHELRRRVEHAIPEPVTLEEYSHGGMAARYAAGAARLPFAPIRSYTGSDLPSVNPLIRTVRDPYGGHDIHVVPPLNPDVTIIHAQRADASGNVQAWGMLGVQQEAAFAASTLIVTVEEIVPDEVVRSDPHRTILPGVLVDAVVVCPGGSHPSPVQGYYDRDDEFLRQWSLMARDPSDLRRWIERHVLGTADHSAFLESLDMPNVATLRVGERLSEPVNFGAIV